MHLADFYAIASKYGFAVISFLIGGLAGFQGIYNKYGYASPRLAAKRMGVIYLLTRGSVPAVLFCVAVGNASNVPPLALALGLGASTELFLRMKFYVKDSEKESPVGQLLVGPFDLLTWYQGLFLDALVPDLQDIRKEVEKVIPEGITFSDFCDLIEARLNIIVNDAVKSGIVKILAIQRADYSSKPAAPNRDVVFKRLVGYQLIAIVPMRVVLQLIE